MSSPVLVAFEVTEHDRGSRRQARAMRLRNHVEPRLRGELVGRELATHVVIQDLGRRAGQRTQARALELDEKFGDGDSERLCAVTDLERRKGMDVYLRLRLLRGATNVQIRLACERRMDAALHADLCAAAIEGLAHAATDFIEIDEIRRAAQVLVRAAFGERAEPALVETDVGVVDVAHDGVTHRVADAALPKFIGLPAEPDEIGAARSEQLCHFVFAQCLAGGGAFDQRRRGSRVGATLREEHRAHRLRLRAPQSPATSGRRAPNPRHRSAAEQTAALLPQSSRGAPVHSADKQ